MKFDATQEYVVPMSRDQVLAHLRAFAEAHGLACSEFGRTVRLKKSFTGIIRRDPITAAKLKLLEDGGATRVQLSYPRALGTVVVVLASVVLALGTFVPALSAPKSQPGAKYVFPLAACVIICGWFWKLAETAKVQRSTAPALEAALSKL